MKLLYFIKRLRTPIPNEKKLPPEAVITLWLQSLFIFGSTMSGTFLSLYLWRLTESLWINGMYNIIAFVFTCIGFIVGGKMTKQSNKMATYRLGIALNALFFLIVLLAGESVAVYYMIFAVFFGIASGFYWTGYWTLLYDVSSDQNRIRFISLNMVTSTIASLAAPVTAGLIFSITEGMQGYITVFSIAFLVFFINTVFSFKIKSTSDTRKKYYLLHMGLLIKKDRRWRKSLYGNIIIGMMQGVIMFLPQILLYHVLKTEELVSYLGAVLSGISIAVSYIFSRIANESEERRYIFWSSMGYLLGAFLLLFELSFVTVIGFLIIHTICNPIKSNAFDSYFYRLIGTLPLRGKLRTESVVIREICWNFGRIIVVFCLIVLAKDLSAPWLPWVIIITSAFQFVLLFFVEKK